MDLRPESKSQNYKAPRRKQMGIFSWPRGRQQFPRTQKVLSVKEKIDKLEIITIKNPVQRTPLRTLKRQATGWEKYTIHVSDRNLIARIYKVFPQVKNKKTKLIFKWTKDFNRHFTKDDTQITSEHKERCSKSLSHCRNEN